MELVSIGYGGLISAGRLIGRALESAQSRGRILITPSADFTDAGALGQLRELSNGSLLILQADEVA